MEEKQASHPKLADGRRDQWTVGDWRGVDGEEWMDAKNLCLIRLYGVMVVESELWTMLVLDNRQEAAG